MDIIKHVEHWRPGLQLVIILWANIHVDTYQIDD